MKNDMPSGKIERNSVIVNIGWLGMDRAVRMGGALLVGTLLARYLGPENFGLLSLATAIYLLFNSVSTLGLDYLVVRDVVLHPDSNHELLGTAFALKALASVLTTGAAVLFTWRTHSGQPLLVWMVALLSVAAISQAFDVIEYFFQARTLSRHTVVPKLIMFVLVNALRIWAIYLHATLIVFAGLAALDIALGEVALLISYLAFPHGVARWKVDIRRVSTLLREVWPLVLAALMVVLYMRVDQIMIAYSLDTKSVGYYSAAVRLSEIWYAIPTLICNSVMPKLINLLTTDPERYYQRLQKLYNYLVAASVVLGLLTMPLSRWAVLIVFGKAYLPAAAVLNVHIWTGVFVFIGVLGGQQLIHEKMGIVDMWRALTGMVVNVGLNLVLIPRFGIMGSAWATLAAQAMASYFADGFSKRTRHIFRMKTRALSGVWLFQRSSEKGHDELR